MDKKQPVVKNLYHGCRLRQFSGHKSFESIHGNKEIKKEKVFEMSFAMNARHHRLKASTSF